MTSGAHSLAMVRKRRADLQKTRGAVVLVHGFGQNRYTWHTSRRSFANYLADQGFDVFNADLRGHGRSRSFGAPRPKVLDEYIRRDMPSFVSEAKKLSGHDRVFLIGHSMGGLISYSAAATSVRDDVVGVVSIGSPYRFGEGSRFLQALGALAKAVRFTGAFNSNPIVPLRFVGEHLRDRRLLWDTSMLPMPIRAWLPGSIERELLDEYLSRAFDRASISTVLAIFRTRDELTLRSADGMVNYGLAFERLDRPLLVVAGTHDRLAPPASVKPAYDQSRSRDKKYRAFPLGHIDLIVGKSAPTTVWPLIRDWLNQRTT